MSEFLSQRYEALRCVLETPRVAMRQTAATLVNPTNGRKGTSVAGMHALAASRKAKRHLGELFAIDFVRAVKERKDARFFVVLLTRVAPRAFDDDGLAAAFKPVRDGIAARLGIDDRDPRVRYVTSQEKGDVRQYLVRAELFVEVAT